MAYIPPGFQLHNITCRENLHFFKLLYVKRSVLAPELLPRPEEVDPLVRLPSHPTQPHRLGRALEVLQVLKLKREL